jgi:hypothetical protein
MAYHDGWNGWLGRALAKVRLHEFERRETAGTPLLAKRRKWFSPPLIAAGNLYLRWLGSGVLVLGDRRWKARERDVYRRLYGLECGTDSRGWLISPEWPGDTVARYAGDTRHSPDDRLRALAEASRALQALHQVQIPCAGAGSLRLSHGDATLRNVNYDPATRRAYWFDFDTMHSPRASASFRLADDLRALLYSAVEVLADLPVPDLYEAIRGAYRDDAPWRELRAGLARGPFHSDPFHLAQARPTAGRRAELEGLIRQG